jgi:predicted metal-dependent hydrolase
MPLPIDKLVRTPRKTIALIIQPDGSLTVRAPLRMSDRHIRQFVEGHADWVEKTRAKMKATAPATARQYAEGETFLFMGEAYPLTIVPRQKTALVFDGKCFRLTKASIPRARELFIAWYKAQAALILAQRVERLVAAHGFQYQRIRISSARTRWGSCSSRGSLSFTYRLVMAPLEVVDYVAIHELVHTQVHNHSKKFWQRVGQVMPEYKARQAWLRKNGRALT